MTVHSLRGAGLLAAATALFALTAPAFARADTVTDWNAIASTAIVATAAQSPPASTFSFAMVQGAVYDAVNAIDRGHRPYLVTPPAKRSDSKDAAAATAAFRVLAALFPSQLSTLQPLYDASLAAVPDTRREARRDRRRRRRRRHDARRPRQRRPLRPVHVPVSAPSQARGARRRRSSPSTRPVGRKRAAIPRAQRRRCIRTDPPNALTSPAYARTSTRSRSSARSAARPAPPIRPRPRSSGKTTGPRCGTASSAALSASHGLDIAAQRAPVRDREPGRRRRRDRLLAQQVPLELLAADHRDPRGRERRQPGHRGRPGVDAAVRPLHAAVRHAARHARLPRAPLRPRLHQRRDRPHPATFLRYRQASPSARSATALTPPEASTGPRTRSRRSSTRASGPASTSGPPTSRAQRSATRSPAGSPSTDFQPVR